MSLPAREALFQLTLDNVRERRFNTMGGVRRLDVRRYFDPDWFARERQRVFSRFPLLVAHVGQIPRPGDCIAIDLPDRPLLLMRDELGVLRAFYNVCRHRGTRLLDGAASCNRKAVVCPYHNWVYALDGRLKSMPQQNGFPGLDKNERGLHAVPLAVSHGFVFVGGDHQPTLDLPQYLAGIAQHWDAWEFADYHFLRGENYEVAANWKAIYDAFCESYHVQRLHRDSLSEFFMDNIGVTVTAGDHMVTVIAREAMREVLAAGQESWRMQQQSTFVYHLFPNSIVVLSPDYINVITLIPLAPDRTRAQVLMLIPELPADQAAWDHWHRSFELIVERVFVKEDFAIAASAQPGLRSGANQEFLLGSYEWPIWNYHQRLGQAMNEDR